MRTKEGAPAAKQEAPAVPYRTTEEASTPRASAHHPTPGDAVALTALVAGAALLLIGLCAATWLAA